MKKWLRRIRAAVLMGLTWGLAWGVVGGAIMEGIVDPDGRILDMWPQTLAIPGFLGGVVFSVVLWLTEGRRRFDELSLPRVAVWGALAGLLLCGLAISVLGASSLGRALVIIAPVTLLSAASAAGTLALARKARTPEVIDAPAEVADMGRGQPETRDLPRGRR